jgi:hypothetical protein
MPDLKPLVALAVLWAIAPATVVFAPVHAQMASCNWYADTALIQQQRNEQGKCGFKGTSWSIDRPAHIAWCARQSPDRWQAEARMREQMLADCRK